jgi:hypothetical protein
MNDVKREYDRKMASLRRVAREAQESAQAERVRERQRAQWLRDREQAARETARLARARASQEALRPRAECCGGPLFVRDNGEGFCRECWDRRSRTNLR